LGVIPARGGSKGIKNKNLRKIFGKPLISYTIKDALGYKEIYKIIVTTDSPKIANVAKKFGAEVPFLRPKELAKDRIPMLAVLKHALIECEKIYAQKIKGIVLFDPTSPIRDKSDIKKALNIFLKKEPDLLVAVARSKRNPYFNMVKVNNKGYAQTVLKGNFTRRQEVPLVYDITNNCWIFSRRAILKGWRIPKKAISYEIQGFYIDIDEERGLELFEYFLKSRNRKVTKYDRQFQPN